MNAPKYTTEEQDPLDLLAEEGLEVAHERMKAQRFGWQGSSEWIARGKGTPFERFVGEIGDFLAVLEHAIEQKKVTIEGLCTAIDKKHLRLKELFGMETPRRFLFKMSVPVSEGVFDWKAGTCRHPGEPWEILDAGGVPVAHFRSKEDRDTVLRLCRATAS